MMNKRVQVLVALALAAWPLSQAEDGLESDAYGDMDGFDPYGDMMGGMGGYGGYGGYGGMDPYGGFGGGYGGYGGYGEGYDSTPAFTPIDDVEGVEKFLMETDTEPAVIGFFNDETNKEDIEIFEQVANANKYTLRFAYSVEDDVREAFKVTSGCAVFVYASPRFVNDKYDKKRARYPGKHLDEGALTKFAKKKALPLVGQRTWKSSDLYESTGLPVLTLFTNIDLEKNSKGFDYYANRLRRVAQDYVGKIVFSVADKEDFSYQLEDYDLELPNKKDVGAGIQDGNTYYKMDDAFSVENLKKFAEDFLAGSLEGKVKEEPEAPVMDEDDDDEDSAVVTVTGDNFDEVVNNPSADVMIEFYAPWCGHCQSLKPVYKKLAAEFEGNDQVTIAAMDATAHDIPDGFDVSGYPTVMFVPAGSKTPIPYEGGRDVASMKSFIQENSKHSSDEL